MGRANGGKGALPDRGCRLTRWGKTAPPRLQQKLDETCWDTAEPERGIHNAEEDWFALED